MAKPKKTLKWTVITPFSEAQYMAKESIMQHKFTAQDVVGVLKISDPWLKPRVNAQGEVEILDDSCL